KVIFMYWQGTFISYKNKVEHIILDMPSVAKTSHYFYERSGFLKISKNELPIAYSYPDRDSILYMLDSGLGEGNGKIIFYENI
ncbi:hypothetical protein, partial [Coprobacillus sp. AF33-1AC]